MTPPKTHEPADWALLFYGVGISPFDEPDEDLIGYLDNELRSFIEGCTGKVLNEGSTRDEWSAAFASVVPGTVQCAYQVAYPGNGVAGRRQALGQLPDSAYPPKEGYQEPVRFYDLSAFLSWASTACTARRAIVVIFGHGAGPGGIFDWKDRNQPPVRPRNVDAEMTLPNLSGALAKLKGAAHPDECSDIVVVFKSCWMACLEVACELAQNTDAAFMVASQSVTSLAIAWDYRAVVGTLTSTATTPEVALGCLDAVRAAYPRGDPDRNGLVPPFSLMDLRRVDDVVDQIQHLVQEMGVPAGRTPAQRQASEVCDASATGPFTGEREHDSGRLGDIALADLGRIATGLSGLPAFEQRGQALGRALDRMLLDGQGRPAGEECTGISVFRSPPWSVRETTTDGWLLDTPMEDYRRTRFNRRTYARDRSNIFDYREAIGFEHALDGDNQGGVMTREGSGNTEAGPGKGAGGALTLDQRKMFETLLFDMKSGLQTATDAHAKLIELLNKVEPTTEP